MSLSKSASAEVTAFETANGGEDQPITTIRNLGPAAAEAFARAGILSAQALRALGPDEAYQRQLLAGAHPHFISYYVLVMGLQGRPWNDASASEKAMLRKRFDAIKSAVSKATPKAEKLQRRMETELRFYGVVSAR